MKHCDPPPTLAEYRALEEAGKIRRPLTDDPMQVRMPSLDQGGPEPSVIDVVMTQLESDAA